jgi:hypothetical protein
MTETEKINGVREIFSSTKPKNIYFTFLTKACLLCQLYHFCQLQGRLIATAFSINEVWP